MNTFGRIATASRPVAQRFLDRSVVTADARGRIPTRGHGTRRDLHDAPDLARGDRLDRVQTERRPNGPNRPSQWR
jgi:hypothetical protein